ncbi:hypothetical protein FNV43_RR14006 [Rhamnella rubrinervis]|uniref:Uncharacterized protein n=1 Tax=Rhamnella rubrinervis TaxID=2594499 RepID=A0A8K0H219_9ROSA|nr:hypothetical protein FNV43_RR14006 [Rhamnella rubrinervis]
MAANVFGNPITDVTLKGMSEYIGKTITRRDRAHVALAMKNSEGKDVDAQTYVENLKRQWGVGVSTLCLVYNATGDTITYIWGTDWYGHIGPSPYPVKIQNGQWAVVYRGLNGDGESCDWMFGWANPWNRARRNNAAYTAIGEAGAFQDLYGTWRDVFFWSRTLRVMEWMFLNCNDWKLHFTAVSGNVDTRMMIDKRHAFAF